MVNVYKEEMTSAASTYEIQPSLLNYAIKLLWENLSNKNYDCDISPLDYEVVKKHSDRTWKRNLKQVISYILFDLLGFRVREADLQLTVDMHHSLYFHSKFCNEINIYSLEKKISQTE